MQDDPLVSVLIATYNRSDVMPRALRSILEQTYEPLEVIIVDDHSDESQRELVDSVTEEYDRDVTFIRHDENRGWAHAMNTAYEHADGEFFAITGDDDEWHDQQKIESQLRAFYSADRDDIGIVTTGWHTVSERTGTVQGVKIPSRPSDLKEHILMENRIIQSISALITREAWEAVGGTDTTITRGIDSDLFRRMIFDGYDVLFLQSPTVKIYVDRDDRMTGKYDPESIYPHIYSERKKFEKFPTEFEQYPRARAGVLEKIGTHWLHIYQHTGEKQHLTSARSHYLQSLRHAPSRWKSWARLGQSLAVAARSELL